MNGRVAGWARTVVAHRVGSSRLVRWPAPRGGAPMARPLRVCLAIGTLAVGGAETQVVGIARELKALGVDVEVIVLTAGGPLRSALDRAQIPVFCVNYRGVRGRGGPARFRIPIALGQLVRLSWHVKMRRFDVLHAFLFDVYAALIPVAWLLHVPVRIVGLRGLRDTLPPHVLASQFTWLSTKLASAVIANADAVAHDALMCHRIPKVHIRVINNAVDIPSTWAEPRVQPPTGVMIANLISYKGHLDLVRALTLVSAPPRVRCIGEGPMRPEIESALRAADLTEVVILEGARPRGRDAYLEAQFAVLTSHSEGMPNAVLEAMAAGLPVVATDVGGCRELVEDGVTGFLVAPRDHVALAHALTRITEDRDFRVRAGEIARERAATFSWAAVGRAHLECYSTLLAQSRGRANR
jgi:glycosyltransferase involved in cell wall biosynthesis